jgi:hypothetical protein
MKKSAVLLAFFYLAASAVAQSGAQSEPPQFYRLDFSLKEVDGSKAVLTRTYRMMVSTSDRSASEIRSGARLPAIDAKGAATYIDIGVNIDVRSLPPIKDGLAFQITADVSSVAASGTPTPFTRQPMIYQTRWDIKVDIPIGKATTVFSSDDPSSKHQLQLEVTATPVP